MHPTQEEKTDNKEIITENVEAMDVIFSGEVHKTVQFEPQGLIYLKYNKATITNKNTKQEDQTNEIVIYLATLPKGTLSNELIETAVRKGSGKRPDKFLGDGKRAFPTCVLKLQKIEKM